MEELKRANKITVYWEGEGVAVGTFYKTHEKLNTIKSNNPSVITAGFVMPEGTPASEGIVAVEVTPQEKLEAFKLFLQANAAVFGMVYDPVDRRPDEFKFPSKYDEAQFTEYSAKILGSTLTAVAESVQANVVDKMVKDAAIAEGSTLAFSVAEGIVSVSEKYGSGSLKYATATYPVTLVVGDKSTTINVEIELVSGQLKKPRNFGSFPFTMTGVKNALVEGTVLPKIEKVEKVDEEVAPKTEDAGAPVETANTENVEAVQ